MSIPERVCSAIQAPLTDSSFIQRYRCSPTAFTRNRKLSFARVVATILHLTRRGLQIECNLLGDRLNMSDPPSKQAFSKARYKISYAGFKALNDIALKEIYVDSQLGLWRGYRVLGTDGSTIRLPWSKELEEYFGQWDRGADRNDNCPIVARISNVVELTTGIVVSAEIAPWCFGERLLATDQISEVSSFFESLGQTKQLYVFDRGYVSKALLVHLTSKGADFLFRMPRGFHDSLDDLFSKKKFDTVLTLYPDLPPLRISVRLLPSGERCVLMTSLVNAETAPADELFQIYWLRWRGCEEGYKLLKVALELENFSGKGFEAILQEFWATVLIVNILQAHCLEQEVAWDISSPPSTRINRSVIFGSLRDTAFDMIFGRLSAADFGLRFQEIARRSPVKIRPGRNYSRARVDKPKRHHVFRRVC